jgi:hypothetical protein
MRTIDIGVGAFFVLLGAFGLTQSLQLELYQRGGIPGPGMFPLILSIALILLGGLVVISRLRGKPEDYPEFENLSRDELRRVVTVVIGLTVSIGLLPLGGYFLSTLALVAFLLFGVERLRSWPVIVTVAAMPTIFYLLFVVVLRVRLPGGFLDN